MSAGSPQTISLPAKAILNGTVIDDGLPVPANLTMTWSMLSGPGPVTFDDPAQAATAASFSTAGSYVLQLSASDGALTANSSVTINGECVGGLVGQLDRRFASKGRSWYPSSSAGPCGISCRAVAPANPVY